jgi:DNA-binding CsgD family transcriptional regulator
VHILPLGAQSLRFSEVRKFVLIMIGDPEREQRLSTIHLQELFGLTRAEARVAIRTLNGKGLQGIASDLSVTISTVRIHLQRVFEKTGTHRQAELVRLLLQTQTDVEAGSVKNRKYTCEAAAASA